MKMLSLDIFYFAPSEDFPLLLYAT